METGNLLCKPAHRSRYLALLDRLFADDLTVILPASRETLRSGLELFRARLDKEWSLTDCISFQIMRSHQLADALTTDHHFEQAGFKALLRG